MAAHSSSQKSIRVLMHQPALPEYRIPVLRELAHREDIDFTLYYDIKKGGPPSVTDVDFVARPSEPDRPNPLARRLAWRRVQWRFATRKHADVLILPWNLHYSSLVPALLRARVNRVPTILWGHGYSKNEATWRDWPRYRVSRLATALVFYNRRVAESYCRRGAGRDRVFVALNSLDQRPIQQAKEPWLSDPHRLEAFRADHDLPGPVILYVSRLLPENRVDLLIEAGARLKAAHPDLRIVVIGAGPAEASLKQLAADRRMTAHVHFVGAIYDQSELAPWFMSSDLFCYPENIGLSVLHAFGYGLPVVTSDHVASQNPEIEALRDSENGLLYRHGDLNDLTRALGDLLSSPERRQEMGAEALRTVTEDFTLSTMVDGLLAAIRYCVKSGKAE